MILSLLLTFLPVSAMAAEENRSEDGQVTADTATEADIDTANSSTYTVEDDTTSVVLEAPTIYCAPLDEASSSDMVLIVEGEWDSYVWEACTYGFWSDWAGDGPSLILSKEDFTSYGFRCTVTRGEQSVTSETFAYDPSVLQRPMLMANSLSDGALEDSSDYIKYYQSGTRFDIQGVDSGKDFQTTYRNNG